MKRFSFVFPLLMLAIIATSQAQVLIDLEDTELEADTFWNGVDQEGGFASGPAFFRNVYATEFGGYWASGWALSSKTDSLTPGFMNLYSARPGSGAEGSAQYAVGQQNAIISFPESPDGVELNSVAIANTTYAFFSMREGDDFAKKFGGESGDDPDFFKLTIFKYLKDSLYTDSVEVYLADYRFVNNDSDYIQSDWITADLSPLGTADSLLFVLSSSDVGQNGVNTPLFFALDNLQLSPLMVSTGEKTWAGRPNIKVYPNPTNDRAFVEMNSGEVVRGSFQLFTISGQLLMEQWVSDLRYEIDLGSLPSGCYVIKYSDGEKQVSKKIVKR